MKNINRHLAIIFSVLCFAVTSTAIGADCKPQKHNIGQSIEDVYTRVAPARGCDSFSEIHFISIPHVTTAIIGAAIIGAYLISDGNNPELLLGNIVMPLNYSAKAAKLARVRQVFPDVPPSLITESYLQKEVATSNTDNQYIFNFNGSRNDIAFQTENLLDKNNVFVVTDIYYGLAYEPASTSDYATQYYTWPDFVELETTAL